HYSDGSCYSRFIRHDLIRLVRAEEWWEYKLVPILTAFYATALVLGVSVISLWSAALSLLLAIVPAAVYASLINDLTARRDDAAGEQLFPALVAVFLVCRGAQRDASEAWEASVAFWALAYGLRGILWHQLTDIEHDRVACVRTFASRHARAASAIGTFVVFPI